MNSSCIQQYAGDGYWFISYKGVRSRVSFKPSEAFLKLFRELVDNREHSAFPEPEIE